jgi:branched-subunit amino acid ABC-type transport system permease component
VALFGAPIGVDQLILVAIVVASAAALAAIERWTAFGIAARAASENEAFAALAGLSPRMLSLTNSVLARVSAVRISCVDSANATAACRPATRAQSRPYCARLRWHRGS